MGVETWDAGPVNIWEPTTHRKVHLVGWNQEVRSSNKAVTFLDIWDGAGNDDISVGAVNTTIWHNSGNDRYFIESGINATIHNGVGFKDVGTKFLLGKVQVIEEAAWAYPVANTNRNIHVVANYVDVDSGFGDDTIDVWGTFGAKVADRGGNNTIKVHGIAKVEVYSGDGNDYIVVGGFYAVMADSGGNNVVDASGLAAEVYTGWGSDMI